MLSCMSPRAVQVLVGAAFAACVAAAFFAGRWRFSEGNESGYEVRSTPGVVTAIRDLSRYETTNFHVEKVVEVTDDQVHLWGLVQAKDALLLVAVGDVTAGVDLGKLKDGDVRSDTATRSVHVKLPAPEILTSALDEKATHVYSRSTDVLAARNEQLEGVARQTAEEDMRKAAVDAGVLRRARESGDRSLRALLGSMGFERIELEWGE
jgi:hypothetical protein